MKFSKIDGDRSLQLLRNIALTHPLSVAHSCLDYSRIIAEKWMILMGTFL